MSSSMRRLVPAGAAAVAAVTLAPAAALAHAGHGGATAAGGALHPLTGLDHLLAMVGVGVWAAQLGGRMTWVLPLTFVTAMILGGAAAAAPVSTEVVEWGILASVLAIGTAIALSLRTPPVLAVVGVAAFALFHGYAHVAERPAGGSFAGYCIGFLLATAALHAAGVGAAVMLCRADPRRRLVRVGGACIVACGVLMMTGAM